MNENVWHLMMLGTGIAIAAMMAYTIMKPAIAVPPSQSSCNCQPVIQPEPVSYIMG